MLTVDVADTPYKRSQGLMFVKKMPEDKGMFFQFEKPEKLSFWNLNTYIPLDVAFIKDNKIVQISTLNAFSSNRGVQTIRSKEDCDKVIEANLGYFNKNGIKENFTIEFDKNQSFVKFKELNIKEAQSTEEIPELSIEEFENLIEDNLENTDTGNVDGVDPLPVREKMVDQSKYPTFGSTEDALVFAEMEKEVIKIWYKTAKGIDIERIVEPHGQFYARTTKNNILVTFDQTVGQIRAFIINNILYFTFQDSKFNRKFTVKKG